MCQTDIDIQLVRLTGRQLHPEHVNDQLSAILKTPFYHSHTKEHLTKKKITKIDNPANMRKLFHLRQRTAKTCVRM